MHIQGYRNWPADPATAGSKFSVHQESPQLILYINCNQAIIYNFEIYTKAIALLYIIDHYIKNTSTNFLKALTSFKIRCL